MSKKHLIIGKADPIAGGPVPDTVIDITSVLPDLVRWGDLGKWDAYCDEQAQQIEEALLGALPGGTYDRLLGLMLARKATHFRVPHREP